jgi:heme/copper-type cytochrome/quinol oxidase subunit 2
VAAALAAVAAASLLLPQAALACPSCYGNAEGPMIDAARVGMYLLLGITLAVQGSFVAFFLYLRRKSRQARDHELDAEWSRLQRAHDRAWRNV